MKKTLVTTIMAAICYAASAQITVPQPSPQGSTYSKVGLTDITIDYSRPKMKGRKIFGEGDKFLVPFGKLWRTGANSGTILKTSTDMMVEGKPLPAGEYMLLTIPGKDSWTIVFYKDKSIGGNMNAYKEADEQLRVSVKPGHLTEPVETLTFNISDISEDNTKAAIELAWENTSVKTGVEVNFDEMVMKQIKENTEVNERNYLAAADYYLNTNRDLEQALAWMNIYLEKHPKEFWNVHTKAQILAKLGRKKEAKEAAESSIELAKASQGGDFGYIKRNEDLIKSL
ncbi:MAG: DUF2911 domain-containing protein [Cyclobacteriaceae bacterium]|nr:DUF2911 domain-containing protein [Cyclobacteriaceae bacterium]